MNPESCGRGCSLARKGGNSVRLAERFRLSPAQVRRIRGPRRRNS